MQSAMTDASRDTTFIAFHGVQLTLPSSLNFYHEEESLVLDFSKGFSGKLTLQPGKHHHIEWLATSVSRHLRTHILTTCSFQSAHFPFSNIPANSAVTAADLSIGRSAGGAAAESAT